MSKKNKEKPAAILELESRFGTTLLEVGLGNRSIATDNYTVNAEGQIIGLTIYGNNITDLSAIKHLIHLQYLDLTDNELEDLSDLPFENLKSLLLGSNRIKSLQPILNLKNLSELAIWDNPLESTTD